MFCNRMKHPRAVQHLCAFTPPENIFFSLPLPHALFWSFFFFRLLCQNGGQGFSFLFSSSSFCFLWRAIWVFVGTNGRRAVCPFSRAHSTTARGEEEEPQFFSQLSRVHGSAVQPHMGDGGGGGWGRGDATPLASKNLSPPLEPKIRDL